MKKKNLKKQNRKEPVIINLRDIMWTLLCMAKTVQIVVSLWSG